MPKPSTEAAKLGWKFVGQNLGRGGQGEVELAVRANDPDGPRFAFKSLGDRGGSKAHARFREELKALTAINHPGIVKVVEYAQSDDDFQYYVMEYVEGAKSLKRRMDTDSNPFFAEPLKAIDGFIQIAEALAECARYRIVHRDLSPANVLVTDDARIKLIDFGLCHIEQGNRITVTDEAVGTPHYRPPECSGYSSVPVTIQADLYSAGKILWSMVTNKMAFDREKPVFNELSLPSVMPDTKMAWHFFHIFEGTIRQEPRKRFTTPALAIDKANTVRRLITEGFRPLEEIADGLCPVCGYGNYRSLYLHTVHMPEITDFNERMKGIGGYAICPYCFHVVFVAVHAQQKVLEGRKQLE
jgi:serine/threonine protein kinase